MTREEAISALKNTAWIGTDKKVGEVEKAIMMAVEALKGQLLREDATKDTTNDDIISRQAAIDAAKKESQVDGAYGYMDTKSIVDLLNNLPSAQPEIIRCNDCKHRDPEDKKCDCGHGITWQLPRPDEWFCADAERRTDEGSN